MKPIFFATPVEFRVWLAAHHATATELLVGFHKRESGRPSLTWPESVDEALCYGWIDGVRRRIDEASYSIRFTPRKAGSVWSAVNIAKAAKLEEEAAPDGRRPRCLRPAAREPLRHLRLRTAPAGTATRVPRAPSPGPEGRG